MSQLGCVFALLLARNEANRDRAAQIFRIVPGSARSAPKKAADVSNKEEKTNDDNKLNDTWNQRGVCFGGRKTNQSQKRV
jgi:hypothetical protein